MKKLSTTSIFLIGFFVGILLFFGTITTKQIIASNSIHFRNDGKTIIFKEELIEQLNNDYKNSDVEKAYCLGGETEENKILINKVDEIITKESGTKTHITLEGECPNVEDEDLVGILHFHPKDFFIGGWFNLYKCYMSKEDILVFGKLLETNQITPNHMEISIIQCGKNKFLIIDEDDVHKSLNWKTS